MAPKGKEAQIDSPSKRGPRLVTHRGNSVRDASTYVLYCVNCQRVIGEFEPGPDTSPATAAAAISHAASHSEAFDPHHDVEQVDIDRRVPGRSGGAVTPHTACFRRRYND